MVLPGTSSSTKVSSALPKRESRRASGNSPRSFGEELKSQQKRQAKALQGKKADKKADALAAKRELKSKDEGYGAQPDAQKPIEGRSPANKPVEGKSFEGQKTATPIKGDASKSAKGQTVGAEHGKLEKPIQVQGQTLAGETPDAGVAKPSVASQDLNTMKLAQLGLVANSDEAVEVDPKAMAFLAGKDLSQGSTPLSKNISADLINSEVQFLQEAEKAQGAQNSQALNEALKAMDSSKLDVNPELLKNPDLALEKMGLTGALKESSAGQSASAATGLVQEGSNTSGLSALVAGLAQGETGQNGDGSENSESSNSQQNFLENLGGSQGDATATKGTLVGKSFTQALVDAQTNPEGKSIDNMPSIVRQVRTFVSDGGGTMNIELSPEGMGNVNLKVAVENGQVSVEMLADNQAAKKALEETLVDMKASLENQKLNVETLKVDFTKDYQKDFSQSQNLMSDQQKRDDAQQFMEQFKQEREERVNSLFGGMQSYIKEPKRPDLGLSTGNSYFGNNKGRSVNLVA